MVQLESVFVSEELDRKTLRAPATEIIKSALAIAFFAGEGMR